ncbi:MAG TPA: hypothetical protein VJ951_04140 [Bacteroidales bacterium]|nr:hypothetical protein [Bacteroidales bacterium]
MRKFLGITLLGVITIAFLSCEKDEIEIKQSVENNGPEQHVISFKDNMLQKNDGGRSMLLDSLIWYTEATLNYSYGFPNLYYDEKRKDSALITVDLIDGCMVSAEDVKATFVEINNRIYEFYDNFKYDSKHVVVVNLELEGRNEDGAGIWVYTTTGKLFEGDNLKSSNPFQFYDWWHGWLEGRCNGYNDDYPSTEYSGDQLEHYYITHNDAFDYLNPEYQDLWFTDVDGPYHFYGYADLVAFETYIWDSHNYDECISPDQMNYFLQHIDEVVIDHLPVDATPFDLEVEPTNIPGGKSTIILHAYSVHAGTYHERKIYAPVNPEPMW